MKIIKNSEGMDYEKFLELSRGERSDNLKDAEGLDYIELQAWALFDDLNGDGSVTRVLAMQDSDGSKYVTISTPFITEFVNLYEMAVAFDRELTAIKVVHGVTSQGQDFLTCKAAGTR